MLHQASNKPGGKRFHRENDEFSLDEAAMSEMSALM